MLVAEIVLLLSLSFHPDYNGENQTTSKMYQALLNASLLGTCQVLGVPQKLCELQFLPSRKLRSWGLESARPTWF